ncbi:hypothetical protein ACTGUN_09250 [Streptococcus suis]
MKKFLFIIMLVCFVVIDGYTALLVLGDLIIPTTTIEVTNQSEDIVAKVKEQFNINYEIKKIEYSRGFPDGYGLEIYDSVGAKEHFFEDDGFEDSEIDAYFRKLNIDTPKYLKVLIIEIILEILLIIAIIRRNKIKQINH